MSLFQATTEISPTGDVDPESSGPAAPSRAVGALGEVGRVLGAAAIR